MDCQHPVGILPVRVFRRNRDTADSAHRLPQATVRRAGRAEDTSVSDEKIEFLLKLEWWNWSGEEIFDNLEILTSEAGLEELMNKYSKRDAIN